MSKVSDLPTAFAVMPVAPEKVSGSSCFKRMATNQRL
jgi:hypothetical protein